LDLFQPDLREIRQPEILILISNNVTRLLDSKKIHYTPFELPVEKLGAEETAEILNLPPDVIFKTIVVIRPKGKPLLCVISGANVVNLKAVAELVGEKKVNIPTQADAENLTGLLAGGISPLALINKGFTVFIDQKALTYPEIHISGGQRGLMLRLNPRDIQKLTNARFAEISSPHLQ
jgi:Cys-tRNA(Pro)/Cys-tRNA(Cys) deacylase